MTQNLFPLGPLRVTRQGYGAMGLSSTYGPADDADSTKTLHRAIELGINFFDTADVYGNHHNEILLGAAFKGKRNQLVIASKFGAQGYDSVAYIGQALEGSLRRLQTDVIDLYYQHRADPRVPIEDVVGTLARFVEQGKIRAIGLSEVSEATLRRAHEVHPIAALQSEYSLWTREFEAGVLPAARELGIGFVAYSPLGRGFLAGQEETQGNRRAMYPRFAAEALVQSRVRRQAIEAVAARHKVAIGQIALAWVLARENVVPIPGTRRIAHLEQNWAANEIELSPEDIVSLETAFPVDAVIGDRYPADLLAKVNG